MTTTHLTHPLAVDVLGRDLFGSESWLYPTGIGREPITDPKTPDTLIAILAPVSVSVREALAAHDANLDAAIAAGDEGEALAESYANSVAAWKSAASSGGKAPKLMDTEATAFALAGLFARMTKAYSATRHSARAVDNAVNAAAVKDAASIRGTLVANLAEAHKAALAAVHEAQVAALTLEARFNLLAGLDSLTLTGAGVPPSQVGQVLAARLPRRANGWAIGATDITSEHRFGTSDAAVTRLLSSLIPIEIIAAASTPIAETLEKVAREKRRSDEALAARAPRFVGHS